MQKVVVAKIYKYCSYERKTVRDLSCRAYESTCVMHKKKPLGKAGFICKALRNFHVASGYELEPLKPFQQRSTNLCYLNFDKLRKILSTNFVYLLTSVIPVSLQTEKSKHSFFFRGDIFCSNVGEI